MSVEAQESQITAHGFLASPISDNIHEKEDGTLVIESCPIGRTGWMTYQCKDLPQQAARELGVDMSNLHANIDLYRTSEDVFAPEFIASLEGVAICDNHPPDFVTPETFSEYAQGHIQNVRKGDEPLDDGEWPLVADLVISAEPLVSKVRNKQARELSLGYDYSIERDGERILQTGMVGNHLAVVPKGRAGDEVRINDSAPAEVSTRAAPPEPEASPPGSGNGHAVKINASQPKREKPKVKNNLLHIFGLGLKAKAADADTSPEELAEMAADVGRRVGDEEEPEGGAVTLSQDRHSKDKRGRDKRSGRDKRGRDEFEDTIDEDHEPVNDRRRAMHDALDMLMDKGMDKRRGKDTDMEELRELLGEFIDEEEAEPQHQADGEEEEEEVMLDADPAELEEIIGAGEEPDAKDNINEADPGEEIEESGEEALVKDEAEMGECAHCGTAHDAENCPSCGCKDRKPADDKAKAADAAPRSRARASDAVAAARATLKMLRPFVARGNDKALKVAFNTALATVSRSSRASTGDYGSFARSARARDSKVPTRPNPAAQAEAANTKLQGVYDTLRTKGGK